MPAVRLLLENGADVNLKGNGSHGMSALYKAACQNRMTVVELLLDNDADVNLVGGYYGSALQASSSQGYMSMVELLLRYGADVNLAGGKYGSALQAASYEGHIPTVQLLLRHGADVNLAGGYGSALQAASRFSHDSVVQLLLDNGADVKMGGGMYGSALIAASTSGGHLSTVQLLLKHGADVDFKLGEEYGSALHEASRFVGYEKRGGLTLRALQREVNFTLRKDSATDADLIVQVEHGTDVNMRMRGGEYGTALQAASQCGHRPTVQQLLDHGASTLKEGCMGLH